MNKNINEFLKRYRKLNFKEQLLKYEYKILDNTQPILINSNSKKLEYANILSNPLVIEPKIIEKLKTKHNLNLGFLI